jgi:ATP-dependent protease ClpP protease subunit
VGRHADQLRDTVTRLADAVADRTGLPAPLVREQFEHGAPMTAADAMARGLLDEVV